MRQYLCSFKHPVYTVVLVFFTLSATADPTPAIEASDAEIAEVLAATQEYVFIGHEASNIVATMQQIARLTESNNQTIALSTLDARLKQGYKTAPKHVVMEALEETSNIIEKHHDKIHNDEQVIALIANLEQCCKMVSSDRLTLYRDTRAPRPQEECGIETEELDKEAPCCDFPRDVIFRMVNIGDCNDPGMLLVAGPSTFRDDITLQPCVGNQFCIFWLEDDGDEKIRMCTSPVENEKGLLFSIDGGTTQNVRIEDNGDLSLEENLNIRDSFDAATGNVIKEGERFIHNFGTNNTFVGKESGNFALTTASENTGFGNDTLKSLTTGSDNTAVGFQALTLNTTGIDNVAVGASALLVNTASDNTAVGSHAMAANTTGTDNVAFGNDAMAANTTGNANVAVGADALGANDTGSDNTAVGSQAMALTTTGSSNVAVGADAMAANTTANANVAVGADALGANDTGSDNVAIGADALLLNTVSGNVAVGARALAANDDGLRNTALGFEALLLSTPDTTGGGGNNNTAVGNRTLAANLPGLFGGGENNTALGQNAGNSLTTGNNNICIGNGVGGVAGESNTCRIGTGLTRCFIDGIEGINVGAMADMVVINSSDQLGTQATTVNIGTNSDTVNVAAGTGAKTINLGAGTDDTVNIPGTLNVNVINSTTTTSSTTTNKTFIANTGNPAGSGSDSGLEIEEGGIITGFIRTNGTRDCWRVKAPANASEINLCPGGTSSFTCGLAIECPTDATLLIRSDTDDAGSNELSQIRFLSGSAGTLQAVIDTNPTSTDFNLRAEGTNNLNLQTGGSNDRLTINNLGNIGIGQTPGSDRLEVTGDTTINGTLTVNNALIELQENAMQEGRIFTNGAGNTVNLQSAAGNSLVFQTDGANTRATISSAGNMIVNAPTSGTTLTLNGTAPLAATGITLVNTGIFPRFTMNTGNQFGGFWWSDFASLGDAMAMSFNWHAHGGSNSFASAAQTSAAIVLGFNELSLRTAGTGLAVPIERLRIDASGNITLSGPTSITNTFNVTGNTALSGPTSITNTLNVTGTAQIAGNVGIGEAPGSEKLTVLSTILARGKILSQASSAALTMAVAGSANDTLISVTRIEWAIVNANGTSGGNSPGIASISKIDTGRYAITVAPAFSSNLIANATLVELPPGLMQPLTAQIESTSATTVVVRTGDFFSTADFAFHIMIMGRS